MSTAQLVLSQHATSQGVDEVGVPCKVREYLCEVEVGETTNSDGGDEVSVKISEIVILMYNFKVKIKVVPKYCHFRLFCRKVTKFNDLFIQWFINITHYINLFHITREGSIQCKFYNLP